MKRRIYVRLVCKVSVSFLSPFEVVGARHSSGCPRDEPLDGPPKVDALERTVQPAGRDAVIHFMRRDVVDSMMLARQDHVVIL